MSRRRNYSPHTIAAMERFFTALDACIQHKLIKNVHRYCSDNGIDPRHLYAQRQDIGRGYFELSWLLPLVNCGVSPAWLVAGRGQMFDPSAVSITLKPQAEAI